MKFTEVAKITEFVKGELDGTVAILTMNRPKALNALNDQTLDELDRRSFTTLFIPGNHENYARLMSDEFQTADWHGGK